MEAVTENEQIVIDDNEKKPEIEAFSEKSSGIKQSLVEKGLSWGSLNGDSDADKEELDDQFTPDQKQLEKSENANHMNESFIKRSESARLIQIQWRKLNLQKQYIYKRYTNGDDLMVVLINGTYRQPYRFEVTLKNVITDQNLDQIKLDNDSEYNDKDPMNLAKEIMKKIRVFKIRGLYTQHQANYNESVIKNVNVIQKKNTKNLSVGHLKYVINTDGNFFMVNFYLVIKIDQIIIQLLKRMNIILLKFYNEPGHITQKLNIDRQHIQPYGYTDDCLHKHVCEYLNTNLKFDSNDDKFYLIDSQNQDSIGYYNEDCDDNIIRIQKLKQFNMTGIVGCANRSETSNDDKEALNSVDAVDTPTNNNLIRVSCPDETN